MDPSNRARVEAWLRYAEDLRLGPYYRDRATQESVGQSAQPLAEAEIVASATPPSRAIAAAATAAGRQTFAEAPKPAPVVIPAVASPSLFEEKIENDSLERIRTDIGPNCTRCKLHEARKNIVFGVGNPKAQLVFVGEGPGRDEDEQGEPFVGRAGNVYICNVVKCRPPENRLPEKDEIATCSPYLVRQLGVIQPKVICCLGSCSAQTMLQTTQGISRFRGEWFDYHGSKLIATYHPAYLLRNPPAKSEVWKDLQKIMAVLGLELPKKK
jgi:DNA polymerase